MYIYNTYLFTCVISQNYVYFRIQWFFHEWLSQNSMIIPWFFHFYNFKSFSWNSMIFPWSWNRSEFQWFFKSCGNPVQGITWTNTDLSSDSKSLQLDSHFLTRLLIGWQLCSLCQTCHTVGSVIHHVIASWKPLRPSPSQVYQMICR